MMFDNDYLDLPDLNDESPEFDGPFEEDTGPDFATIPLARGFPAHVFGIVHPLGGVICGGFARWCAGLSSAPPGDLDVYCPDQQTYDWVVSALTAHNYKLLDESEMSHEFESDINVLADGTVLKDPLKIQVIKPIKQGAIDTTGGAENVLSNFDFTVVRAAIVSEKELLVDRDFFRDEDKRLLVIRNIHCPVSTLIRCVKYGAKGYRLPVAEAIKLFQDWTDRSDSYRAKLLDLMERRGELSEEESKQLYDLLRID